MFSWSGRSRKGLNLQSVWFKKHPDWSAQDDVIVSVGLYRILARTRAQNLDLMIRMEHTVHCSASQNQIRERVQATEQNIPEHHVKQNHHQPNHRIKNKTSKNQNGKKKRGL